MVFEAERRQMVEAQLRRRGIHDERVLNAMLNVPRHEFVPREFMEHAYQDRALPIGATETISQPYMVAAMTAACDIEPGDKVLEIGTGSGYQAAVLAYLGARVYSVEKNATLAARARATLARLGYSEVEVICGDGTEGYAASAPYQAILVTAGSPQIPSALIDQLVEGGRLVIPVGSRDMQQLELVHKTAGGISTQLLDACRFVPLTGKFGWPEQNYEV
ncbi:MAG TPA: protein-L-isoaspartate(D-aspartate) O-methyltransferase [Terriglobia bacterium]|nr:protein-L-isoaspartate(D-aspartate) O-methyltransferase [Terriglobia bacterium]